MNEWTGEREQLNAPGLRDQDFFIKSQNVKLLIKLCHNLSNHNESNLFIINIVADFLSQIVSFVVWC